MAFGTTRKITPPQRILLRRRAAPLMGMRGVRSLRRIELPRLTCDLVADFDLQLSLIHI